MATRLETTKLATPLVAAAAVLLGLLAGYDPAVAIAAALGLAFVLLVLADLTIGLVAFTVLAFLGLLPSLAGPSLSLPKLAGLLLAISWLAVASSRAEAIRGLPPGLITVLVLFLAWAGLSVVWAESHSAAVSSIYRYALNLALFPIVFTAVRSRRHAVWVVAAFVAGATIAASYGLLVPPDTSQGGGLGGAAQLARSSGTIGDPNELAAVLVAGFILAAALSRLRRSPLERIVLTAAAALCLITLFLTLSRGGLVALAAALLVGILVGGRWRSTYAVVAVVAAASAFVYFGTISSTAGDRVANADGGTGRTDIWKVAWRMVEDKPVQGAGAGNFSRSSIHYVLAPGPLRRSDLIVQESQVAHNTYLGILSELGVVGLALFLAIVATSVGLGIAAAREFARRGEPRMELLARAVVIATAGLLAADFFLSSEYNKQLWLLLALGPALNGLARGAASPAGAEAAVEPALAPGEPAQPLEAG